MSHTRAVRIAAMLFSLVLGAAPTSRAQAGAPAPAPQLVPRFSSDSGLLWEETANPNRYFDAIGRKAAVFGKQDGKFEAWVWPIKILHGFRLEFRLDNMPEPVRAENYLQSVQVRPESTTLLYVHPNFTVKQTVWAADDRSAIVIFFDVDSDRPLSMTVKFVPDFKPMWPASMGGQHSGWLDEERAFTLSDGTYKPTAVIGSPATSANTEFMDHSLVGGEMLLRLATTPAESKHVLYPLVMALSLNSPEEARATYRDVLAHAREMYERKVQHWRDFLANTLQLETPSAELNRAFVWAKVAIEQGWVCTAPSSAAVAGQPAPSAPPEGFAFPASEECGMVAGYGPAGDGERPGFAWWFGGDGMMASWAMLDYGDAAGALRELRFLRAHQRADGKMMHEMVQSAGLVDWWGKYHFGYMHADTTPMYLYSLGDYWRRTGDRAFLQEFWPSAKKAYDYCLSTLDPADGLIDNTKSGLGAVEVGVLRGTVKKDVYVQGFWIAGLRAMAELARANGEAAGAADAEQRLGRALASLREHWRDPDRHYYAFGLNTEGQRADLLGNWSAVLLSAGGGVGPNPTDDEVAVQVFALPELSTDWGSRWISDRSPLYDPVSYNNGTAWPFAGGFVAWAQYVHGQPLAGYQTLMSLAHLSGAQAPGVMPEHMVGNRNEPGARSVPHQLFSSWSMVRPLVSGLLGFEGLPIAPSPHEPLLGMVWSLPPQWTSVSFANYKAGTSTFSGSIRQSAGRVELDLAADHPARAVAIAPLLPFDATVRRVLIDGKPAKFDARPNARHRLGLALPTAQKSHVVIEYTGGISVVPFTPAPERGAPNTSLKILNVNADDPGTLRIAVAGLAGRSYSLDLMAESAPLTADGASHIEKTPAGYRLEIPFAEGDGYLTRTVVVKYGPAAAGAPPRKP